MAGREGSDSFRELEHSACRGERRDENVDDTGVQHADDRFGFRGLRCNSNHEFDLAEIRCANSDYPVLNPRRDRRTLRVEETSQDVNPNVRW